jgi:hypothetical protein
LKTFQFPQLTNSGFWSSGLLSCSLRLGPLIYYITLRSRFFPSGSQQQKVGIFVNILRDPGALAGAMVE